MLTGSSATSNSGRGIMLAHRDALEFSPENDWDMRPITLVPKVPR
jgi:hypothetical protein